VRPVLLLNEDFAPLDLCRTPRALALVEQSKAEVVEHGRVPMVRRLLGSAVVDAAAARS
jgi:hypothetical protein